MDIVDVLRARAARRSLSAIDYTGDIKIDSVAADEIERLREALRDVMKVFKQRSFHPMSYEADYFRIARAALGEEK